MEKIPELRTKAKRLRQLLQQVEAVPGVGRKKLLKGKTVAVDSTTLEANAAIKSIERKDTGEDWNEYLTRLKLGSVLG